MKTFSPEATRNAVTAPATRRSRFRWIICGLLFVATMINYVDRQTVAALNPTFLKKAIGWTEAGYGWITFSFLFAYALMFPIAGRILDRVGVRRGMIGAVVVWSLAAMSHAFARSPLGFALARFGLGLGEATNFPGCIKAVAEWFPRRERSFATGLLNAGSNVGIMASPLIVYVAMAAGWQWAFIATGCMGLMWLALWWWLYDGPGRHRFVNDGERAWIAEGSLEEDVSVASARPTHAPADAKTESSTNAPVAILPWPALLRHRQAWAVLAAKLFTDPVWYFYLSWLPAYLNKARGLSAMGASTALVWPYLAADVGSVVGGWLPGKLMQRGWAPGRARLWMMALYALGMPGAIIAARANSLGLAIACISVATSCHQAWSANVFTLASDMFPKRAVGSVVGLASMCGAMGGMFMALVAGGVLQWFGTYAPLFFIAGFMHPLAFVVVRALAGRDLAPADLEGTRLDRASRPLLFLGAFVGVAGAALVTLVVARWTAIANAATSATAAGGLVASLGLLVIGTLVIYAGAAHRARA